jgi:hypothetical protein
MSAYEVTGNWKSPRKIEEEILLYQRKRFEEYMEMEDVGMLTRELALAALREELEAGECPTEALDANELKEMLEEES